MNSVSQSEADSLGSAQQILLKLQYMGSKAVAFFVLL